MAFEEWAPVWEWLRQSWERESRSEAQRLNDHNFAWLRRRSCCNSTTIGVGDTDKRRAGGACFHHLSVAKVDAYQKRVTLSSVIVDNDLGIHGRVCGRRSDSQGICAVRLVRMQGGVRSVWQRGI